MKKTPRSRARKSTCAKGHSDWYVKPDGTRQCRICSLERVKLQRTRLRLEHPPTRFEKAAAIRREAKRVLAEEHPATVRHIFYQLRDLPIVVREGWPAEVLIAAKKPSWKSDRGYDMVSGALTTLRRDKEIPYEWLVDAGRTIQREPSWKNPKQFLQSVVPQYHLNPWDDVEPAVIVGIEKLAMKPVIEGTIDALDVPLVVTRGFTSLSYAREIAKLIQSYGREVIFLYCGDSDHQGHIIDTQIEDEVNLHLERDGHDIQWQFQRIAVLPWQIEKWGLKQDTDSKGRLRFELDSIKPSTLRELLQIEVGQYITDEHRQRVLKRENRDRKRLERLLER